MRKTLQEFSIDILSIVNPEGIEDTKLLPKIPPQELLKAYRWMLLTRRLEEQALRYQRQGRIGTFAPSIGQEAAAIGSALCLTSEDWFLPSFRETGIALTRGLSIKNYFLYIMGFEDSNKELKNTHDLAISIPVGSQCVHVAGIGWGLKLDQKKAAAMVYFGDGATSEGDFHEGLNFCGALNLPCVFFCQNNQWAISTPFKNQTASQTIAQKAIAYGVKGIQVDGNDFFSVYVATQEALNKARKGEGPTLIEAVTFRQSLHTTADDPSVYRTKNLEEEWKKKDPILRFKKFLEKEKLWDSQKEDALEQTLKEEIRKGYEEAENFRNSNPDPLTFFDTVYETMPPYLQWQKECAQKNIAGRNVIKGALEKPRGSGGAAAVGELEEAQD
ncbi:MAG: pyruvate dehydrogenase (acetyl-transferring) E1 component subunit alpha [Deltaproteobacteria bacterium GWA2_38_16]|nr:MAG: pyruvate dehydrogenase (acetyl-transferring) E1 component subunit alpha [Deltaproteobacteria bacterium GWA2_38_16]OGQ03403.1 MAG: pyruvate dehydrogenase (acetyl-transferring) E1 component subunit alpha [Deltaproteobacteria bacterium RIFCSPHIGHO2_02_FULL_38_15]OGQ34714.1 MAG: pyruvate dehydrogenase (acetyl-transferring) E1 component subunit alpha [Deltaproteobacteria bacterium RIFCSPLOWO2_01_FULL_38_9]